jgi:hypothetical protein
MNFSSLECHRVVDCRSNSGLVEQMIVLETFFR